MLQVVTLSNLVTFVDALAHHHLLDLLKDTMDSRLSQTLETIDVQHIVIHEFTRTLPIVIDVVIHRICYYFGSIDTFHKFQQLGEANIEILALCSYTFSILHAQSRIGRLSDFMKPNSPVSCSSED